MILVCRYEKRWRIGNWFEIEERFRGVFGDFLQFGN